MFCFKKKGGAERHSFLTIIKQILPFLLVLVGRNNTQLVLLTISCQQMQRTQFQTASSRQPAIHWKVQLGYLPFIKNTNHFKWPSCKILNWKWMRPARMTASLSSLSCYRFVPLRLLRNFTQWNGGEDKLFQKSN